MRLKPQQRRRKTAVTLGLSSPATISHYISFIFREMLRRYFCEFKSSTLLHRVRIATLFFLSFVFSYVLLNSALDSCQIRLPEYLVSSTDMLSSSLFFDSLSERSDSSLETVLKEASMHDRTVILTTLNEAWANPDNSILDLFLASFGFSQETNRILNHLVIIALDQNAFASCKRVHTHCFTLKTEGLDFS